MYLRTLIAIAALAALTPLSALAAAPEATTDTDGIASGVDASTAVIGSWFDGSISSIQFYDRDTGVFQDPNGEGFYVLFLPDGSYREGAVITSDQYPCSMRLLGENQGTWHADATSLIMDQTGGSISIANTCGDSGVYPQGVKQSVYLWSVGPDDYGTETLSLATTDSQPYGRFHRWDD